MVWSLAFPVNYAGKSNKMDLAINPSSFSK